MQSVTCGSEGLSWACWCFNYSFLLVQQLERKRWRYCVSSVCAVPHRLALGHWGAAAKSHSCVMHTGFLLASRMQTVAWKKANLRVDLSACTSIAGLWASLPVQLRACGLTAWKGLGISGDVKKLTHSCNLGQVPQPPLWATPENCPCSRLGTAPAPSGAPNMQQTNPTNFDNSVTCLFVIKLSFLCVRKLCNYMFVSFFFPPLFFWRGREAQEKGKSNASWALTGSPHHHLHRADVSVHGQWEQRRNQHFLELLCERDAGQGGGAEDRSGAGERHCGNLSAPGGISTWTSCEWLSTIAADDIRLYCWEELN